MNLVGLPDTSWDRAPGMCCGRGALTGLERHPHPSSGAVPLVDFDLCRCDFLDSPGQPRPGISQLPERRQYHPGSRAFRDSVRPGVLVSVPNDTSPAQVVPEGRQRDRGATGALSARRDPAKCCCGPRLEGIGTSLGFLRERGSWSFGKLPGRDA